MIHMNKDKFKKVLDIEKTHTDRAMIHYKELLKENIVIHYDIFILSVICPIFAAVLSYFSYQHITKYRSLFVLLILVFLGYCPSLIVLAFKEGNKLFKNIGWHTERYKKHRILNRIFFMLFHLLVIFFRNTILFAYIIIIAAIIATPILLPISFILNTQVPDLPIYVGLPIQILIFLIALAYVFSATHPRILPLKEVFSDMFIGLVFGFREIIQFFTGIVIGSIFVGVGILGIVYQNMFQFIIITSISGIMYGFSVSFTVKDIIERNIIHFGKVRCYLRLNKRAKARYILHEIKATGKYALPEPFEYYLEALWLYEKGIKNQDQQNNIKDQLLYSAEVADCIEEYCEEWVDIIRETGLLIGINNLSLPEKKMEISDLELIKRLEKEVGFTLEMQEFEKIHEFNRRGFAVDKNNQIIGLNLDEIKLDSVPTSLPSFRHLKNLRLSNTKLKDFSFLKGLSKLTQLTLRKNEITDISFLKGLSNLTQLDLSYNQITDISFLQGLSKLTKLFLGHNQIADISFLQGLNNLTWLALWNNQITDISFLKGLSKIEALDLRNNEIKELPKAIFELGLEIDVDKEFECRQKIYLYGNPLENRRW